MTAAFISYSFKDRSKAQKVADALRDAGLPPWMAQEQPMAGVELSKHLQEKIENHACFVLVLTPEATKSEHVANEVRHALAQKKQLVMVSFGRTSPGGKLPEGLRDRVWIEAGAGLTKGARAMLVRNVRQHYGATAPIVTMLNLKGGVGKTTLAANIFGCMHEKFGKSILLIDFDPQHNLTQLIVPDLNIDAFWEQDRNVLSIFEASRLAGFGASPANDLSTLKIEGAVPQIDAMTLHLKPRRDNAPRFDLVLGHFAAIKYTLPGAFARREELSRRFTDFLRAAQTVFDVIVLDVNPGSTALTEMAVQQSTHILAPFRPDRYSKHGLRMLGQLMTDVYKPARLPKIAAVLNGIERKKPNPNWPPTEAMGQDVCFLKKHIGFSTLLSSQGITGQAGDFTRGLAYRNNGIGAQAIRKEIEAAAEEYMRYLLEPPNA